ncbi:hypothetical protein PaG_02700 [Moesziomyces aphidis]|uniref:Uncharacterized protein n=1 Tax=Moesziomyces aphidis TaxID=84754 RepID=W3VQ69_MOEAP|nr:hypothetical protein PaG_02700 [Moesziomyces aphidis]
MPLQDANRAGYRRMLAEQRRQRGAYDPARLAQISSRHAARRTRLGRAGRSSSKPAGGMRMIKRDDTALAEQDVLNAVIDAAKPSEDVELPPAPAVPGAAPDPILPSAPDHSGAESDPNLPPAPDHSGAPPPVNSLPSAPAHTGAKVATPPHPSTAPVGQGSTPSLPPPANVSFNGTTPVDAQASSGAGPADPSAGGDRSHHTMVAVVSSVIVIATVLVGVMWLLRRYRRRRTSETEEKNSCQLTSKSQRLHSLDGRPDAHAYASAVKTPVPYAAHTDSNETLVNITPPSAALTYEKPMSHAIAPGSNGVASAAGQRGLESGRVAMPTIVAPRPLDSIAEVHEIHTGTSTHFEMCTRGRDGLLSPDTPRRQLSPTRSCADDKTRPLTAPSTTGFGKPAISGSSSLDHDAQGARNTTAGGGLLALSRPHSSKGRPTSSKGREIEMTRKGSQLVIRDRPSTATLRPMSKAGTTFRSALRRNAADDDADGAIYIETDGIVGPTSRDSVYLEAPAARRGELSVPVSAVSRREGGLPSRFSNSTMHTARRTSCATTVSPTGSFSFEIKDAVRQSAPLTIQPGAPPSPTDTVRGAAAHRQANEDQGPETGGSLGEGFVQELDWNVHSASLAVDGYPPFGAMHSTTP